MTWSRPTAAEIEDILNQHVLDVWFPRSIDSEYGGFLCDFDRRWSSCGPHTKLLEFQARHTLLAAEASQLYPGDERLRHAARHGFRYLREVMWDRDSGGWFHRLDRAGEPLEADTKHTHGAAYALQACAAVYRASGDSSALDLACDAFEWLEAHAHDRFDGGYFGLLARDGTVILDASRLPWDSELDTIGTPVGLKDLNVHSDLLEALIHFHGVRPVPTVAERVKELVSVICDRALTSGGALAYLFQPNWRPVPHLVRFGTGLQTIHRLISAGRVVDDLEPLARIAHRIARHALEVGWDRDRGGFCFAAPATAPTAIEGHDVFVRRKSWWVQAEGLRAMLALSALQPQDADYAPYFHRLFDLLKRDFLDQRYGGMYATGLDHLPRWRRKLGRAAAPSDHQRKGTEWKDASHDGRAWLDCLAACPIKPLEPSVHHSGSRPPPPAGAPRPTR
ncbi:MAG: AGE family epimerase/isomerase [Gemmatimonadota bacterium]